MRTISLLLALSGCTWISSADVEEQKKTLDEDGDGYDASKDCDDTAKNIHPDAEDAWYDGVDSNCDGANDYDQDGDGSSSTVDCNDTDATILPGMDDPWYDGVDSDCGGQDDYDQDADGYVPDEYVGLPTAGVDGSGALDGGDCDDTESDVNPGVNDAKYDAVDADCGGNDDYDQDGDGHVPEEYEGSITRYVPGSGSLPADDCDDTDPDSHPGATEVWYDGVNQDCGEGDDDYDQDLDGWVPSEYAAMSPLPDGDCDDTDPAVRPGGIETIGDGRADGDCDGDADSATLIGLDGFDFADGHNPILVESETELWLSVVSSQVRTASETFYQAGASFRWALAGIDNNALSITFYAWSGVTKPEEVEATVTGAHAAAIVDGIFYGAIGSIEGGERKIYEVAYDGTAVVGSMSTNPSTALTDVDDIAMVVSDSGEVFSMACSSGQGASWAYLSALDRIGMSPTMDDVVDDVKARACGLEIEDETTATLPFSDSLNVWDWNFDPSDTPLVGTNGDHLTAAVLDIDTYATVTTDWRVLSSTSFGGVRLLDQTGASWTVGEAGDGPINADADLDASGNGVVAWVNSDGSVRLAIGGLTAGSGGTVSWTYYDIPTELDVDSIAVHEVDGTVVVAAAGNDGVGIAILRT